MSSLFIPDGYTIKGRIRGMAPYYPDFDYEVRPAAMSAAFQLQAATTAAEREEATLAILCRHVVGVRPVGEDGPLRELKIDQAKKLFRGACVDLFNVVMGYSAPETREGDEKNSGSASGSP